MKQLIKAAFIIATFSTSACAYNVNNSANMAETTAQIQPSDLEITAENLEVLNHQTFVKGVICSAHTYNMNVSNDVTALLTALDKDNNLQSNDKPDITFTAQNANSSFKCVQTGVMSGKCQSDVTLSGKLISKSGKTTQINIEKSATQDTSGCEGATGSLKTANAEALEELVAKIRAYE